MQRKTARERERERKKRDGVSEASTRNRDVTFEDRARRVGEGKEGFLANVITAVHLVANYSEIPARPVLSSVN